MIFFAKVDREVTRRKAREKRGARESTRGRSSQLHGKSDAQSDSSVEKATCYFREAVYHGS